MKVVSAAINHVRNFGANQRVIPSKRGAGFGVLFEIDGWTCGYTAPRPTGMWMLFSAKSRNWRLRASIKNRLDEIPHYDRDVRMDGKFLTRPDIVTLLN
jgi:hypothetical protein